MCNCNLCLDVIQLNLLKVAIKTNQFIFITLPKLLIFAFLNLNSPLKLSKCRINQQI